MMENNKLKLRFPRAFFSSCKKRTLVSDVIIQQQQQQRLEPMANPAEFNYSPNSESPPLIPFSSNSIDSLLPHQYSPVRRRRSRLRYNYPSRSCKPRCPESLVRENCILSVDRRRKIFPSAAAAAEKRTPPPSGSFSYSPTNDVVCAGRRCPPASPASPFGRDYYYYYSKLEKVENQSYTGMMEGTERKSRRRKTNNRMRKYSSRGNNKEVLHCNNVNVSSSYDDKSSSDDEREEVEDNGVNYDDCSDSRTGTFFSSTTRTSFLSLSSPSICSSDSGSTRIHNRSFRNKNKEYRRRPRARRDQRRIIKDGGSKSPVIPPLGKEEKVVKGCAAAFAVVKRSNDPYSDFRDSMIEMIVERQMFRKKELELLLDCFLSLNTSHHHQAIVEVFLEIWDALFST